MEQIIWDNESEMRFLKHYHSESVLWDTKNPHYKDKYKNYEAWKRISTKMNIEINDLKKKKDSLLSSFRLYRKKIRDSTRSGAKEVYKPIWFAYSYMDSFLGEGLTVNKTTDAIHVDVKVEEPCSQEVKNIKLEVPPKEIRKATKQHKDAPKLQKTGNYIKKSRSSLNQAMSRNTCQETEDDCDRYGKILANKLRQLPEDERLIFMYQIDGMFIQRHSQITNPLSSPLYFSSPSPSPTSTK